MSPYLRTSYLIAKRICVVISYPMVLVQCLHNTKDVVVAFVHLFLGGIFICTKKCRVDVRKHSSGNIRYKKN